MADIAQIGFRADTADLDAAKQKLEALPAAAASAERASDKLEKTLEGLSRAAGDMVKAADALTKASDKLATSHKSTASNSNDAKSATDKLNGAYDKSVDAAAKAAASSKKLEDQVAKTAAATVNATSVTLRSLKDEAAARLAASKPYESGIVPRVPGERNSLGGINVPKITDADRAYSAANIAARAQSFKSTSNARGAIDSNFTQDSAKAQAGLDAITGKAKQASAANDNLKKSLDDSGVAAGRSGSMFGSLASVVVKLATSFAAIFTINKLADWLVKANSATVALGETAKRTGIDLQRLQQLQFAGVSEGMSRQQVNTGVEGLAEKLNEARQTENSLSKLFDENNIKLKDRTGQVISTNDALAKASGLIQNAATEFDKIKIAEALGLTRDWIPLLEQGPDALNRIASGADAAGNSIDAGMVQRAQDFQRDWATAIDRWVTMFQAAAGPIIAIIDALISKAAGLFGSLNQYAKGLSIKADIENNGANVSRESMDGITQRFAAEGKELPDALKSRLDELNEYDREKNRATRAGGPLQVTVNKPTGGFTKTKSLFPDPKGGGGGSGDEKDDFDTIVTRAEVRIQKLQAERDAIGLNAEAAARLKYETDLLGQAKKADIDLTDEQKSKLTELAGQMATTEVQTKQLKDALDFGKDLTKGFLTDFLNGVKNGESIFQSFGKAALGVLNKISDKLISMAVDSLFSTGKGGGGISGLFGSIGKLLFGGGSALGDAFTGSGKVSAFANGGAFTNGVYSRPTLFRYANGGSFGVMGEAGPEAVMPLKRGPDGSLGVQMQGDSGNAGPNIVKMGDMTNVYRIEGAISSKDIVASIQSSAEKVLQQTKREVVGWLDQYNADGALV